jgi:hypothetical protein
VKKTLHEVSRMKKCSFRKVPTKSRWQGNRQEFLVHIKFSRGWRPRLQMDLPLELIWIAAGLIGWLSTHRNGVHPGIWWQLERWRKVRCKKQWLPPYAAVTACWRLTFYQKGARWIVNSCVMLFFKSPRRSRRRLSRKVESKECWSIWLLVKPTILQPPQKDSKFFTSPGHRIRHILLKSHYDTSDLSSGTKLQCKVSNFKFQTTFEHRYWIPPRLFQCRTSGLRNLKSGSPWIWILIITTSAKFDCIQPPDLEMGGRAITFRSADIIPSDTFFHFVSFTISAFILIFPYFFKSLSFLLLLHTNPLLFPRVVNESFSTKTLKERRPQLDERHASRSFRCVPKNLTICGQEGLSGTIDCSRKSPPPPQDFPRRGTYEIESKQMRFLIQS